MVHLIFGIMLLLGTAIILYYLAQIVIELSRLHHLKSKCFLNMEESRGDDRSFLEITAETGIKVTTHYAEHIYSE